MRFFSVWTIDSIGIFCVNSAWISSKDIYDYLENKEKFCVKNNTPIFKKAVKEIEGVLEEENLKEISNAIEEKITLKNVAHEVLVSSYGEHETVLRTIFDQRRHQLDRFNYGNDYDYLTVLSRTLTSEQQQVMFLEICANFMGNAVKYMQNPIVSSIYEVLGKFWKLFCIVYVFQHENLFWTILLPEWAIAVCSKKYGKSKGEVLNQIKKDEEDSFLADDSFILWLLLHIISIQLLRTL